MCLQCNVDFIMKCNVVDNKMECNDVNVVDNEMECNDVNVVDNEMECNDVDVGLKCNVVDYGSEY